MSDNIKNIWRAVSPIRQYDDKLELICNSYNKGHDTICIFNTKEPANILCYEMPLSKFTINHLKQGEYGIYTKKNDAKSLTVYVNITCETAEEYVKKLKSYFVSSDSRYQDILDRLLNGMNEDRSINPVVLLANYLNSMANKEERIACGSILKLAQTCNNYSVNMMNVDNIVSIEIHEQNIIESSNSVTEIILEKLQNQKFVFSQIIKVGYDHLHTPTLKDNTLYKIRVLAKDKDIIGEYYLYNFDDELKKEYWKQAKEIRDQIKDSLEQSLKAIDAQLDFTEYEQSLLAVEKAKNPVEALIDRPDITVNNSDIEIHINNYDTLKAFNKDFYVVAKELDTVLEPGFERKELITAEDITMNKMKHLLVNEEDYCFFIQDENGILVSDVIIQSLAGEDRSEYNNKTRQLKINEYCKHLYLRLNDIDIYSDIKDIAETVKITTDVQAVNLYKNIIENLVDNKYIQYFNRIVNIILFDRLMYSNYDANFFPNKILYEVKVNELVFPPKQNRYIIQEILFNMSNHNITTNYYMSGTGAVELRTDMSDYCVYQAIDINTYEKSGYVFFDNTLQDTHITKHFIGVETI